ncbi:MAG: STT3 domain-containing protein [Myxococcota bacterium]|nr:STT3 domain-containing protein [Myxococcota bacterium]
MPTRSVQWRAPLGLFALAFCVRMLPRATVFSGEGAHFTGNDAYYHMRRVLYGLEHFPDWLDFDPYLNFPQGARPIWTPLFDWLSTLAVLPFDALGGVAAAEWAAATIPALLGASCVVVLYLAARRCFDEATARLAGLLLALLTAHVWYSTAGFFDHHAAVALMAAVMLWAAFPVLAAPPTQRASLLLSTTQATALLLWPGMLLQLALIELGVLLHALQEREHGSQLLRQRALGHALALGLVAPLCLIQSWPQWSEYSANVLSRFQPWVFAAMASHAACCAALWRRRAIASGLARFGSAIAVGLAVAALSVVLLPGLADSPIDALRWLGKQEQFQSQVTESKGILQAVGGLSAARLLRNLSGFGLLLPITLAALLWRARSRRDFALRLLVAIWSGGLMLATLQQRRFGNSAALGVALVSAWAIRALWLRAASLERVRPAQAAIVLATALLMLPTLRARIPGLEHTVAQLRGEPIAVDRYLQGKRLLLDAGRWLREHGGHDPDFNDSSSTPPYGVMAPWHLGHRLLYSSRLPMVVGNFGDDLGEQNFELHRRYLLSAEPHAAERLDRVRARFVVTESLNDVARARLGERTMIRRLTEAPLKNLAFHRLRYATEVPTTTRDVRVYRVFERVAGAEIVGSAPAGASVSARIIVSAGTRAIRIEHETTADEDGRYRMRLAHASKDAAVGGWRLRSGDRQAELLVPLEAVLVGERLAGPRL